MNLLQSPLRETLERARNFEIQRGLFAEGKKPSYRDPKEIARHMLAAARLELVLVEDYLEEGNRKCALISLRSAGACFWRGGNTKESRRVFERLLKEEPAMEREIRRDLAQLEKTLPKMKARAKLKSSRKVHS